MEAATGLRCALTLRPLRAQGAALRAAGFGKLSVLQGGLRLVGFRLALGFGFPTFGWISAPFRILASGSHLTRILLGFGLISVGFRLALLWLGLDSA